MQAYEKLLKANKQWASEQVKSDPQYFNRLVAQQSPEFLWIGCSDSRVPADKITGTDPGEIFVHRNLANLVVNTDTNFLSVLQYAVEVLKVRHIIVCGHYGCGGVKAALGNNNNGIMDCWFREIKDIYRLKSSEFDNLTTEQQKLNKLVELNVAEQVFNLAKTSIVQKAWKNDHRPHLHGWVYDLNDGIIKSVTEMAANSSIDPIYTFNDL